MFSPKDWDQLKETSKRWKWNYKVLSRQRHKALVQQRPFLVPISLSQMNISDGVLQSVQFRHITRGGGDICLYITFADNFMSTQQNVSIRLLMFMSMKRNQIHWRHRTPAGMVCFTISSFLKLSINHFVRETFRFPS